MPQLIILRGLPASGKSTLAKLVAQALKIHLIDVDDARFICTGPPHPRPEESPELRKKDGQEMGSAYATMLFMADRNLKMGRDVILTATFSRSLGKEQIDKLVADNPGTELKIVWCNPRDITQAEVELRLRREGYRGATTTFGRWQELQAAYERIDLPMLDLNTAPPHTVNECVRLAIDYIEGPAAK